VRLGNTHTSGRRRDERDGANEPEMVHGHGNLFI